MKGCELDIAYLLFLFYSFVSQVNCDCDITKDQLNGCTAVITMHGNYLRTTHIMAGQTLSIYPFNGDPVQNIQCLASGKFSSDFPTITKKGNAAAFADCQGKIYKVGYNINGKFQELYHSCYDRDNYISRYSVAYLYPQTGVNANRPESKFTLDGIMSGAVDASITQRNVKNTFATLYNSKYDGEMSKLTNQIDRGHLVAADDFLTYDQKVATNKMINVIPQFHSIQGSGGNWFKIEQYVRALAAKNLPRIRVQTGSYDVLELINLANKSVPANLYYDTSDRKWKFPVPAWMYKLVENSQNERIFAIITSNNPFSNIKPPSPACCTPIPCPGDLNLIQTASLGYTYCCNLSLFKCNVP